MSATLGGLIKDYRIQKNVSQLEIAFALGWKEPSRLSRIEQGKVGKPKRKLLERIIDSLRLEEKERNQILLAGSYLPTKREIDKVKKDTHNILTKWKYPAVTLDFSWRIVDHNDVMIEVYGVDKQSEKWMRDTNPRVPELYFTRGYPHDEKETSLKEEHEKLAKHTLLHFKFAQRTRTREKWYVDMLGSLMKNKDFRKVWLDIQNTEITDVITNAGRKKTINPDNPNKLLTFDYFIVPFLKDPRFTMEFHTPADLDTMKYFTKEA